MSLHTLAHHLQSAGRNGDSVLVHMTPGEVQGLQALAMAHGGSLTINPHTGLPESFFLAAILPTLAGIGLKAAGMSALNAALTVGAVGTLATGSLSKGLMAGLGAFGGANLAGSLGVAGGAAAGAAAGAGSTAAGSTVPAALRAATEPALRGMAGNAFVPASGQSLISQAAANAPAALRAATDPTLGGMAGNVAQNVIAEAPSTVQKLSGLSALSGEQFSKNLATYGRGLKEVASSPEKLFNFVKENPGTLATIASSVAGGMPQPGIKYPERQKMPPIPKFRYEYDTPIESIGTAERNYFPGARFVDTGEVYAARGGLMSLAEGGTVEEMSRLNAIGANTMYPMANQMSYKYSTPRQRPISENVVRPEGDARLDPYTGEMRFAEGGAASESDIGLAYSAILGREADPAGLAYYAGSGLGIQDIQNQLAGSSEGRAYEAKINAAADAFNAAMAARSGGAGGVGGGTSAPAGPPPSAYVPGIGVGGSHYVMTGPNKNIPIQLVPSAENYDFEKAKPYLQEIASTDKQLAEYLATKGLKPVPIPQPQATPVKPLLATTALNTTPSTAERPLPKSSAGITAGSTYGNATTTTSTTTTPSPFDDLDFKLGSKTTADYSKTAFATPEQVANTYQRLLGRQIDLRGLEYYTKINPMTVPQLEKTLRDSPEYFENLAKPFVAPITYGPNAIANVEGGPYYSAKQYGYKPSSTNATNEIIGMYQDYLGRPPDKRGLEFWKNTIGRDNVIEPKERALFATAADKEIDKRLEPLQRPITSPGVVAPDQGFDIPYPGIEPPNTPTPSPTPTPTPSPTPTPGIPTPTPISQDPNAYKYNYWDNSQEDNSLIKQFQTGPNERARADLVELYMNTFKRIPDKPGFDYYMQTIGADNEISNEEKELFLRNAQPELSQRKALEDLYKEIGGRGTDIPGREYWMSQIGRAGGIEPVREQIAAGLRKEVDMGDAGYPPAYTRDLIARLQNKTQEQIDAENAKAPFLYGIIPGSRSPKYPTGLTNNKARERLYELYEQKIGRKPDMAGFDYWINTAGFGNDDVIDSQEEKRFLDEARARGEAVRMAYGGLAGLSNLGGYSDGGRLLKGPGDGVSDSIPAVIGNRQPARLADGEFVIPARIVSELGNGSTDAGARKLYAMMDRIQRARKKSTGKERVAINSRAEKYLPA